MCGMVCAIAFGGIGCPRFIGMLAGRDAFRMLLPVRWSAQ
jgi:hypothetical protein